MKETQEKSLKYLTESLQLSKKCFDGAMLFDLMMSNGKIKNTQIHTFKKQQPSNKNWKILLSRYDRVVIDSKRNSRTKIQYKQKKRGHNKSALSDIELYPPVLSQQLQRKKQNHFLQRKIINALNTQSSVRHQKTNFNICNYQSQKIHTIIKPDPVMRINLSVKTQHGQKSQRSPIKIRMKKYNKSVNLEKFRLDQFIQTNMNFHIEPIISGKIGNFSSQSITILKSTKRIYECQGSKKRQIASLTKIMTCLVCLFLSKKYSINTEISIVRISRIAASILGTSANLKHNDHLTINQLLYGMMLPSGNDAAYALGQYFGKIIYINSQQYAKNGKKVDDPNDLKYISHQILIELFIKQMNNLASYLKMESTIFNNTHGLSDEMNKSTSNDIAELCYHAMQNDEFKKIVATTQYQVKIYNQHKKFKRTQKWINTNKLLEIQDCFGIKTGITPTAGPCMTAYFQKQNINVIIVILKAKSKASRFIEVKRLWNWVFEHNKQVSCQLKKITLH